MRRRAAAVALALPLLLAGCSQVDALAPVGGDRVSGVRYASIDVLTAADVDVMTAPVCAQAADKAVTCEGTTMDGRPIRVVSTAADQASFTVTVGTTVLFTGDIQSVLEKAMQTP